MSSTYISTTQTAQSIPFDNTGNGFTSTDVQSAIVESTHNLIEGEASATADATTNSGTDSLLTGMTDTPVAGTYLVWFSTTITSPTAGAAISISIYVGGVQKADSLRKIIPFSGGTLTSGNARGGVFTNGVVTVNGSQAIEIRWSTSSGTMTSGPRTLNILRVG